MSIAARDWAWEQDLPAGAKLVLLALAERADASGCCWPSIAAIAKRCGMSRSTVFAHINRLVEAGLVERGKRERGDGSQTTNAYRLGARPVAQGARPVAQGARPVAQGARPVGRGARPVGRGARPVGRGARPVGRGVRDQSDPKNRHLEPSLEPSVNASSSPQVLSGPSETQTRAARPVRTAAAAAAAAAARPTPTLRPFDLEAVTAELVAKYADRWPEEEVRERIAYALSHKKGGPLWSDKRLGLRRWLQRDADREDADRARAGPSPPRASAAHTSGQRNEEIQHAGRARARVPFQPPDRPGDSLRELEAFGQSSPPRHGHT